MSKNPYLNHTRKPNLKISYCIFLDVLGYGSEIISAFKNKTSNKHLANLYKSINKASKYLTENNSLWKEKIFTDNVVLGMPIDDLYSGDEEGYFGSIITSIVEYQLSLVLDNYFVRGGWTIGELFMNEKIVYGNSVIEAYQLENKVADFPRIIFSKNMARLIRKHLRYYSNTYPAPQKYFVLKDSDGNYFVNYLISTIIDDDYTDFDSLKKHRDIIVNKLSKYKTEKKYYRKYLWCARYHNYFLHTYVSNCPTSLYIKGKGVNGFNVIP